MMIEKFLTLALIVTTGLSASSFRPRPVQTEQKLDAESVRRLEYGWPKAYLTGDADYVDRLLEPDYESVNYKGETKSRQQIIDGTRARRDHPSPVPTRLRDLTIQIQGNAATSRFDVVVDDSQTKQKRMARFVDTLVFYEGRWHVLYSIYTLLVEK
ncbi:MAG TPA: nuclear transport factor 2 family protein [Blastocatellia bacterium]|nr:nuclear transport factor 2 family protein [Blastocatellia bacterium]